MTRGACSWRVYVGETQTKKKKCVTRVGTKNQVYVEDPLPTINQGTMEEYEQGAAQRLPRLPMHCVDARVVSVANELFHQPLSSSVFGPFACLPARLSLLLSQSLPLGLTFTLSLTSTSTFSATSRTSTTVSSVITIASTPT